MSLWKVPVREGGGSCRVSKEPLAGHAGIQGNSSSGTHPPETVRLTKSVAILTNPVLINKSTTQGRKGNEKNQIGNPGAIGLSVVTKTVTCMRHPHYLVQLKQTAQPHTAGTHITGMHNTCNLRNPICHIEGHDSLTTTDQHNGLILTYTHNTVKLHCTFIVELIDIV